MAESVPVANQPALHQRAAGRPKGETREQRIRELLVVAPELKLLVYRKVTGSR